MGWYLAVLRNYAGFRGRAAGLEFWVFFLFQAVILGALYLLGIAIHSQLPFLVYSLATAVPTWAVIVRRLHDTGRGGWWILFLLLPIVGTIVVLLLMADEGELDENRFGPQPHRRIPPQRGQLSQPQAHAG
ncbi:uncharacterized membrane protein YhaH (DUF805 family) [Streptomyces sp. 846.5]|nr:DUF805 domain-containing protein [Streptomyces sp. 846.5]TDU03414.1 uncharacterized membrane protein YhaH (DUF805 family) [Streptomyces sp. 846.5]